MNVVTSDILVISWHGCRRANEVDSWWLLDLGQGNHDLADADGRIDGDVDLENDLALLLVAHRGAQRALELDPAIDERDGERAVDVDRVPFNQVFNQVIDDRHQVLLNSTRTARHAPRAGDASAPWRTRRSGWSRAARTATPPPLRPERSRRRATRRRSSAPASRTARIPTTASGWPASPPK